MFGAGVGRVASASHCDCLVIEEIVRKVLDECNKTWCDARLSTLEARVAQLCESSKHTELNVAEIRKLSTDNIARIESTFDNGIKKALEEQSATWTKYNELLDELNKEVDTSFQVGIRTKKDIPKLFEMYNVLDKRFQALNAKSKYLENEVPLLVEDFRKLNIALKQRFDSGNERFARLEELVQELDHK